MKLIVTLSLLIPTFAYSASQHPKSLSVDVSGGELPSHFIELIRLLVCHTPDNWNRTCPRRTVEDAVEKFTVTQEQLKSVAELLGNTKLSPENADDLAWCIIARKEGLLNGGLGFNPSIACGLSRRVVARFSLDQGPASFNNFSSERIHAITNFCGSYMPPDISKLVAAHEVDFGRSIAELLDSGVQFNIDNKYRKGPTIWASGLGINSLKGLQRICQNCEMLDLSRNYLNILEPDDFLPLTNAREIDFWTNDIAHIAPGTFKHCKSLIRLDLQNNLFTDIELGSLPHSLTSLNLSNNRLTKVPPDIWHMKALRKLNLEGNNIPNQELQDLETWWEEQGKPRTELTLGYRLIPPSDGEYDFSHSLLTK